jgi:cephalosporin hydroxylase
MDPVARFAREVRRNIRQMATDARLRGLSLQWMSRSADYKYTYNFRWMGRPVIQFPQDLIALQEIIWTYQPEAIIETGVAHGGSLVFHASMLELLGGDGIAVGVDIDVRPHNRAALEAHRMFRRIRLVEGSSTDRKTVLRVRQLLRGRRRALVILDSNHTHAHVLRELELYSPLVRAGGHLVVLATVVEDLPSGSFAGRPWDKGNNPRTAVDEFLKQNSRFVVDSEIEDKLLISVAPGGYLKCVVDQA